MENKKSSVGTIHICTICCKRLSTRTNLNTHMKKLHGTSTFLNKGKVCPLCKTKVKTNEELDKHVTIDHQVVIEQEQNQFASLDEFQLWKENFENETKSSYVYLNSWSGPTKKIVYYECHRSGFFNLRTERQRSLKLKGSNKINSNCPARMKLVHNKEDNIITVNCVKTHVGHDLEVSKLRLTPSERQQLAEKQLQGIQNHCILEDITKTFDADKRISYITNHDLHNIRKSFNVKSDVIFHDAAKRIDILVKKYKHDFDNPILDYKPYGVKDSSIGENNFFLIFMNSAQQEMLSKHGNDILLIDSTHGTNPYKIHLTTLMVVDSEFEGFPVALLWSITQTEEIFSKFFSSLKSRVPELKPKIFMSDDSNAFYNAFVNVFGSVPKKLLCDRHVKKNIIENLSKITNIEKRKQIKKQMSALINELDVQTFDSHLKTLVGSLVNDPDTTSYGNYFLEDYANRPEQWAHCYRKSLHRNTNLCLDKWHQELKNNSSVRGKFQRLDISINNIIECLRMKFMKRPVIARNKVPHKLSELKKRHRITKQKAVNVEVIEEIENSKWLISSSKNSVKEEIDTSCNQLKQTASNNSIESAKLIGRETLNAIREQLLHCDDLNIVTYATDNLKSLLSGMQALQRSNCETMTKEDASWK